MVLGIVLLLWLTLAQGCFRFRVSDQAAYKDFRKANISLHLQSLIIDGRSLHYAATGDPAQPLLVFVHGSPGSWDAFASYLKDDSLRRWYRMVSIDRPGFGYSDFGCAVPLAGQALLINKLIDTLAGGKQVYLAGHSLGGPLVVALAAHRPQRTAGIAIVAGSLDPAAEKPEGWRRWLKAPPLRYFVPGAFRPSNDELWYLKNDLQMLLPAYDSIACPVYLVHGTADRFVPYRNLPWAVKKLAHAPSIDSLGIEGGSHFILWTAYPAIRDVLLRMRRSAPVGK